MWDENFINLVIKRKAVTRQVLRHVSTQHKHYRFSCHEHDERMLWCFTSSWWCVTHHRLGEEKKGGLSFSKMESPPKIRFEWWCVWCERWWSLLFRANSLCCAPWCHLICCDENFRSRVTYSFFVEKRIFERRWHQAIVGRGYPPTPKWSTK